MKHWWPWVVFVLGIVMVAGGVEWKYHFLTDKMMMADDVSAVRRLMLLPSEQPEVAMVTDETKLRGQKFFENAQNGDKVLIFVQSGRAVLYRPSINRVVEVTTVSLIQPTPTVVTLVMQAEKKKVTIYNGTRIAGLSTTVGKVLEEKMKEVEVVDKQMAIKRNYSETRVYDIGGQSGELVKKLAAILEAKVGNGTPSGEKIPPTDLLIVLGEDNTQ